MGRLTAVAGFLAVVPVACTPQIAPADSGARWDFTNHCGEYVRVALVGDGAEVVLAPNEAYYFVWLGHALEDGAIRVSRPDGSGLVEFRVEKSPFVLEGDRCPVDG